MLFCFCQIRMFKLHRPRPLCVKLPQHVKIITRHLPQRAHALKNESPASLATEEAVPDAYLEPFVRAFVLGISSGAVLEASHVAVEAALGLWGQFAPPLFLADHAAAIACWATFYIIDVVAIKGVLELYRDDAQGARQALKNLVTLPKRMLPLRLALYKGLTEAFPPSPAPKPADMSDFSTATANPAAPLASATLAPPSRPHTKKAPQTLPPSPYPGATAPPPRRLGRLRQKKGLRPGQFDPSTLETLSRRRKELADRRAYLHGFWYAAALSQALKPDAPLGVDILSRRVVLFRDSVTGEVRGLDDACPHRGAPLSSGWLKEEGGHSCVVCPYHGWALDGEGRLRDVPAEGAKAGLPRRPMVPTHDVQERDGFVWLWYGPQSLPADARPPIPSTSVPELSDPSWKPVYGEIEFETGHFPVFENAIDMSHIHYLHGDSFGNQESPEIRDMRCTADAHSVTATFTLQNKPASVLWEWTKVPAVEVTARAFLPSTSAISFTLGNGLSFTTFVNTVPISANKSINRFALVRNLEWDRTGAFNAAAWDGWARSAMMKILGEDKLMVETLRPELLAQEFSVRSDLPQVMFRKLRQQWVDLGYVRSPEAEIGNGVSSQQGETENLPDY